MDARASFTSFKEFNEFDLPTVHFRILVKPVDIFVTAGITSPDLFKY